MKDEKEIRVYDWIKGNLINAVIVLTGIFYILFNLLIFKKQELTFWETFAPAVIGVICGLLIKQCMGENGFNKGYGSHIWVENLEKYSEVCNTGVPYIERVDYFYQAEEMERKKAYRRAKLMDYRMRYDWFFDDKGNYIENTEQYNKLTRQQRKCLKKCIKVKIYVLNLFSEYAVSVDADTHKEKTDKDQRVRMFGKNSIVQIITASFTAIFYPMLTGWDWAKFIVGVINLSIWLCVGVIQLYTNYNFIVVDKVSKLTRKKELITKFVRGCECGKYTCDPFDEVPLIEEKEINNEN